MTDFPILPKGSEWASVGGGQFEERPYRECPNCGRYRFRRIFSPGGFILSDVELERCRECKLDRRYEPDA